MEEKEAQGTQTTKRWFIRPLIILGLIAVGLLVALVIAQSKPQPYSGSRKAADAFIQAFALCDFDTAQKYYVPFRDGSNQALQYQNSCVKGALQFNYSKQLSASTSTEKGKTTKTVNYQYNFRKNTGEKGTVTVVTTWTKDQTDWQVQKAVFKYSQPTAPKSNS
jgi:hypothetical protein